MAEKYNSMPIKINVFQMSDKLSVVEERIFSVMQ